MRYLVISSELDAMPARKRVSASLLVLLSFLILPCVGHGEIVLSGEWESSISVSPQMPILSAEIDLTVEIAIDAWIAEARSVFEDAEWVKQDICVETELGDFSIESDLRFEPYKHRFRDWINKVEWESTDLVLTATTKLTRTTDWVVLEFEREGDTLEINVSARLRAPSGSCSLAFYDANVDLSFDWCGADTDIEITIDDDGFDEWVVELSDLTLVQIPWCTFDLEFTRTAEKTSLELTPIATLETSWCAASLDLEFEAEFPNAPHLLPLTITEAVLSCDIGEWEVETTVLFDPSQWIAKAYWLELQADAAIDLAACGEVSLELVFLWTEAHLGRALFELTYEPGESFSISIEGDLDLENRELDQLIVTLQIEW